MNIGIDIDGVLTNDDEYTMSCMSKFIYDNKLEEIKSPYEYEYDKVNWNQKDLEKYLKQYFWDYCEKEPARKYASEIIKKLKEEGNNIYIITSRRYTTENSINGENSPKTIPIFVSYTHVFCYDCRYNQKLNLENMTRVYSWYDIYNKIKELERLKD